MALGRLLVALFRKLADARKLDVERAGQGAGSRDRWLLTRFGWVRYWRVDRQSVETGRGFHPLDVALGLTADRVGFAMAGLAVRLATKLAFAEARDVLGWFTPTVPSTEVIERAVVGLGEHTEEWFRVAPALVDDGQVLIILADSKGAPTATTSVWERRRGPRRVRKVAQSPRHRGRSRRGRYGSKPRRKKGDKSKHARMATMMVMYTLTRVGRNLPVPQGAREPCQRAKYRQTYGGSSGVPAGMVSYPGRSLSARTPGGLVYQGGRKRCVFGRNFWWRWPCCSPFLLFSIARRSIGKSPSRPETHTVLVTLSMLVLACWLWPGLALLLSVPS